MVLLPFSLLRYSPNNPLFAQVDQVVSVSPQVGFSAVSYVLSAGTLPVGLALNATTGVISGTPTTLTTTPVTVTITATLADSNTTSTNVIFSIVDVPVDAATANTNSTNDRTNLKLIAETNFVNETGNLIQNAIQLGQYHIFANVPLYASMLDLMTYFQGLNYSWSLLYPTQNPFVFTSQFGQLPDFAQFPDFTQPYPIVTSPSPESRKVMISWSNNLGAFPFWLYPYTNYPTYCT
jgi:hypothetical protein